MGGPRPLPREGRLAEALALAINLCFRFPVSQSDNATAYDFKQALVNRFLHTTTPISLPSWGHIDFYDSFNVWRRGGVVYWGNRSRERVQEFGAYDVRFEYRLFSDASPDFRSLVRVAAEDPVIRIIGRSTALYSDPIIWRDYYPNFEYPRD